MSAAPLLVLWDIDHTLVSISGVGREIYTRVFEQVTGQPLVHLADMRGLDRLVVGPDHDGEPRVRA